MSAELLTPEFYFPYYPPENIIPIHNVVHDLEAFFWVMVWYCMCRGAPTTRRSELFARHHDIRTDTLRNHFFATFESDNDLLLATAKISVFRSKITFTTNILCHFSEYCAPLKPLAIAFYSALVDAHEHRAADGLYEKVLDAFNRAETLVNELPEEYVRNYRDQQEAEETRRGQESPGRWDLKSPSSQLNDNANPDDPVHSLPPDPGSPTPAGKRAKLTSGKGDKQKRR